MSGEAAKALVAEFIERVYNANDPDAADQYLDSGFVNHNPYPGHATNRDGFKDGFRAFRSTFADLQIEPRGLYVDGDMVIELRTTRGVHRETGASVSWDGVSAMRVDGGRIVEHWGGGDRLGLLLQLDIVPPEVKTAIEEMGMGMTAGA